MELRFLYVGCADTERDLASWLALPGGRLRWRFRRFGADVAAVDTGAGPLVVLADHRPAGSILPIYAVTDLEAQAATLRQHGWTIETGELETAEGPAMLVSDPSGVELALLRVDRPDALDAAFTVSDPHAVDPPSA